MRGAYGEDSQANKDQSKICMDVSLWWAQETWERAWGVIKSRYGQSRKGHRLVATGRCSKFVPLIWKQLCCSTNMNSRAVGSRFYLEYYMVVNWPYSFAGGGCPSSRAKRVNK